MQVTRLLRNRTRNTTLAIGDGANDVGMLQEADIGIGISGFEGMQVNMLIMWLTAYDFMFCEVFLNLLIQISLFLYPKTIRQSCQATLQLHSSVFLSAYYLYMVIGVTEGCHQW